MMINLGDILRDSHGNLFKVAEKHSGFVWLYNERGDLKQIGTGELRFFKTVAKEWR